MENDFIEFALERLDVIYAKNNNKNGLVYLSGAMNEFEEYGVISPGRESWIEQQDRRFGLTLAYNKICESQDPTPSEQLEILKKELMDDLAEICDTISVLNDKMANIIQKIDSL